MTTATDDVHETQTTQTGDVKSASQHRPRIVALCLILLGTLLILATLRLQPTRVASSMGAASETTEGYLERLKREGPDDYKAAKAQFLAPLAGMDDAARKHRLGELLKKFVVEKDEFDNKTTYRHKAWSRYYNANGTTLRARIIDRNLYLDSAYVGSDWLFHKEFVVKVGDTQLGAEDDDPRHDVNSGGVCELVSAPPGKSVAMAQQIANSKEPVRIRLTGRNYRDYTLREEHRRAIAETLELWKLLGGSSSGWIPYYWDRSRGG